MSAKIANPIDNYVKSKELRIENKISRNSDSRMIIKLAYYNEQSQADEIRTCCESNNSKFIPLVENKFGILNETPWNISYGQESSNNERSFGVKAFIDIYNCVENLEKKKWRLWKKDVVPYIGELLDNKFFLNILFIVSNYEDAEIVLKVLTKSGNIIDLDDLDEIKEGFRRTNIKRILNLSFRFNGQDVSIDKSGYIDISSNTDFFNENENVIRDLIINGFRGDYGKYYL